jgi:hypothetical protein
MKTNLVMIMLAVSFVSTMCYSMMQIQKKINGDVEFVETVEVASCDCPTCECASEVQKSVEEEVKPSPHFAARQAR